MEAPDGTRLFVVIYRGQARGDLLRIWKIQETNYILLKEKKVSEASDPLSANGFRYNRDLYLHISERIDGTAADHIDELFRIESGILVTIHLPKGLPFAIGVEEEIRKGFSETFADDRLEFEFGIYNKQDGNCCPNAGWVKGTYSIVGNELRYATWNRSKDIPY